MEGIILNPIIPVIVVENTIFTGIKTRKLKLTVFLFL